MIAGPDQYGRFELTLPVPAATRTLDGHLDSFPRGAFNCFQEHVAPMYQRIPGPLNADSMDQQNTKLKFWSYRGRVASLNGHLPLFIRLKKYRSYQSLSRSKFSCWPAVAA